MILFAPHLQLGGLGRWRVNPYPTRRTQAGRMDPAQLVSCTKGGGKDNETTITHETLGAVG